MNRANFIFYGKKNCYNENKKNTRFTGSKPNLNKMHIFGMNWFCYVQNKMKLYPHSEKGIFVGYD